MIELNERPVLKIVITKAKKNGVLSHSRKSAALPTA